MVGQSQQSDGRGTPVLDFSSLIMGFSSAALYHIGYKTVEGHGPQKPNLAIARQNIEIIRMLREKTKGNLTSEEKRLLAEVLEDLDKKYDQADTKQQETP